MVLLAAHENAMRFVILGPGALGSVIGATLARAGHDVSFLGRSSPQLRALRERGLSLTDLNGRTTQVAIPVSSDPRLVRDADTIIVLVKTVDTFDALHAIRPHLQASHIVLTLQNGLGNAKRIRELVGDGPRVLAGVTSQGATRLAPGSVLHAGAGPTLIGASRGEDAAAAANLAAAFTAAGLPAAMVPDIDRAIWHKVAVNAAINGITALGGFPNGALADNAALLDAAETIAEEVASVARANGFEIGPMRRPVLETAVATTHNRSSMLQDLDAGRPTEVADIHGAVLAAGEQAGIDTPAIRVIAALIKAKEQRMAGSGTDDD